MRELTTVIKLIMLERKDIFLSILFGFLAGMGAVSLFANSGYLISMAAINPPLYVLTTSIALLKLFSATRAASKYGERYFSHRATFTMLSNLRVHFFEKLEPLAPRIFHRFRSGDLLSRIVGDVESLQNFFLRVYYPPIVMMIVFLSTIAFTTFFSVHVAVTLLVGLVLTGFVIPAWFALKQYKIMSQLREKRGVVSTEATEFFYGFRDLKLYQKLDTQEKNVRTTADQYVKEQRRDSIHELYSTSIIQMISLSVSWFVLGLGAYLVGTGELEGVFLAMLVMISLTVFENATPMAIFPAYYEDSRRAATRLFSVINDESENKGVVEEELLTKELQEKDPISINMNNISFSYPGEARKTLSEINIDIPSGTKTAIVGPSGSGKSTLIQLLLKFYDEYDGDIVVNGSTLAQVRKESVWKATNTVLQSNHFFYGTIRDNLLLARDTVTDEEMKQALEMVDLNEFSLDDKVIEKGGNLSGGEKQRLAIARAILKGSRLWLLDEPTSSVDFVTEKKIYSHLFDLGKEDTVVLISHRLTGLEQMDQIIVMEHGRVVETGTYDELMERKGYFYQLKEIEKSVLM
ncbi:thiol reductant ABC exporter subunit CydC [Evansella sp. AB-rgal1]|uniref:thiol reductant ABC exporter subunit CydC n=1 Tax=Evansella sp. AB-rgal1 TaxID=3242696 RepID=UPI00359DA05E